SLCGVVTRRKYARCCGNCGELSGDPGGIGPDLDAGIPRVCADALALPRHLGVEIDLRRRPLHDRPDLGGDHRFVEAVVTTMAVGRRHRVPRSKLPGHALTQSPVAPVCRGFVSAALSPGSSALTTAQTSST